MKVALAFGRITTIRTLLGFPRPTSGLCSVFGIQLDGPTAVRTIDGPAEPAQQVSALRALRAAEPWHWLIDANPLATGLTWQSTALPALVPILLCGVGVIGIRRRDLR